MCTCMCVCVCVCGEYQHSSSFSVIRPFAVIFGGTYNPPIVRVKILHKPFLIFVLFLTYKPNSCAKCQDNVPSPQLSRPTNTRTKHTIPLSIFTQSLSSVDEESVCMCNFDGMSKRFSSAVSLCERRRREEKKRGSSFSPK